jgi:hypothetical protein
MSQILQAPDARPQPHLDTATLPRVRRDGSVSARPTQRGDARPNVATGSRHARYAVAWAAVGLLAGGYVVTVLMKQDTLATLAARTETITDTSTIAPVAGGKTQSDVADLQRAVGSLESDMARLKAGAVQQDEREKSLSTRVAVVETRIDQFATTLTMAATGPAASARLAKAPPPAQPKNAAAIRTGALPEPVALKDTPGGREVVAARQANPIAAPENPTVVADAASAVLLARGPSLDALRLSWSLLNERHKGTLKSLEPRVVQVEPGSYQLLAGPIANPADAMKVCAALKARGVACQAADFKGDGL